MQAVLTDLLALEKMLEADLIETGPRRIGAEQEMFLVDKELRPAPVSDKILAETTDPRLVAELARFNLEANCQPQLFRGGCLSAMEAELEEVLALARRAAKNHGADVALVGVLPTIESGDLGLQNMYPSPRYRALNDALARLRGGEFRVRIEGIDELETSSESVMMESCNTSFQIHFQVSPAEFARMYNVAQAISAPVLASAVNSPLFLGRRLWHETRVALFANAVDSRSTAHVRRGRRPRVYFGDAWIEDSVLEIFREQISRFRVVLSGEGPAEDPLAAVERGEAPPLSALMLHGGTVYRWNRACYGVAKGVAHLRIEHRALPAGPTVADEMANAALFFGLMSALPEVHSDIRQVMAFEDAKDNFFKAARYGLDAELTWFGGEKIGAARLLLERLIPLAREGLERSEIDSADVDHYLSILEARVTTRKTGASWALGSLAGMGETTTRDARERTLVRCMMERQAEGRPVHTWPLARPNANDWRRSYRTVSQFMATDLYTVRPEDLIDLAASVMDWEKVRHVPVEDDQGHLLGLITHRTLVRLMARRGSQQAGPVAVKDIMRTDVHTVAPDTPTLDAMHLMRGERVGCLPVVEDGKLVGLITESDLIDLSAALLEQHLGQDPQA